MKRILTLTLILVFSIPAFSQEEVHPRVDYFGYVEGYYVYDFNEPFDHIRQPFLYNFNRHNTFTVNQAVFALKIDGGFYRGNVGFQAGTYPQDNFAETEDLLQHIYQANVGVSLNEKRNLWVDAGVFRSHLGNESSIGIENYNLTRSLAAENAPYFLAGVKLTYTPSNIWTFMVTVNNGWQRINRVPGNQFPGIGGMVEFRKGKHLIHYGGLVSNDYPEADRRIRIFNDLFYTYKEENWEYSALFDLGFEQDSRGSDTYSVWGTYNVTGRYTWNDKWKTGFRAEIYVSDRPVIAVDQSGGGPSLIGGSLNLDYQVNRFFILRFEPRYLYGHDSFYRVNTLVSSNFSLAASMAVRF